jgi:hypothetical protein
VVQDWWRQALPFIRTKSWSVSWQDFLTAWSRVLFPNRDATLAQVREAVFRLVPLAPSCPRLEGDLIRLQLAAEMLAGAAGGGQVPLGCRAAADLLGVSARHASRLIARLVRSGELVLVAPHDRAARRAAEYHVRPGLLTLAAAAHEQEQTA